MIPCSAGISLSSTDEQHRRFIITACSNMFAAFLTKQCKHCLKACQVQLVASFFTGHWAAREISMLQLTARLSFCWEIIHPT